MKIIAIDFYAAFYQVSLKRHQTMYWILFICKESTSYIKSINQSRSPKKNICWYGTQKLPKNLNIYLRDYQTETAIFLATKHKKTIMACSYLNFPYRKYIKTAKNGGFCEVLLSENDFEAVLVNFCCYEYIIVPMLLRQFRSED